MVKKPNTAEQNPKKLRGGKRASALSWVWAPEYVEDTTLRGNGPLTYDSLIEQKAGSNDTTDYFWYMTSVDINKDDPVWTNNMTLQVNTSGHVLHAFVNGVYVGSDWGKNGTYNFIFDKNVNLNPGKNQITLLSATVGLKNYGYQFDLTPTGVSSVQLIGNNGNEVVVKDLSKNKWANKIGLHGEQKQQYNAHSHHAGVWLNHNLPSNKMMVWYKTTFTPPLGKDAVVVDLQGMGKGHAWVNGKSIGRYWPSYLATESNCSATCDYRGPYSDKKCVTNCGVPSQRWYHVPRSFLQKDKNILILFEETGGSPSQVNFQTVTIGSACGQAHDGNNLELSCGGNGRTISSVKFASFGDVKGTCGSFLKGTCESSLDSLPTIQKECVGKESCVIEASENKFGESKCGKDVSKKLVVEIACY